MKTIIITAAIILLSTSIHAAFYRCQVDGRTIISNVPCAGKRIDTLDPQTAPAVPEAQQTAPAQPPSRSIKTRSVPAPSPSPAPTVRRVPRVKKYDINHRVRERTGVVEVSGRATGPRCDSLRIQAFARSDEGNIIECVDVTSLSGNSTTFSCQDNYPWRSSDGRPRDWFVSSIYATCQD